MVSPELRAYVARLKAAGYSEEAIRAELARAGWSEAEISAAFAPRIPLIPILICLVVAVAAAGLVLGIALSKPIALSIQAMPLKSSVVKGEQLVAVISLNASRPSPILVGLEYSIKDAKGNLIEKRSEQIRLADRTTLRPKFNTTELAAGKYAFSVVARWNAKEIGSSFSFSAIEKAAVELAQCICNDLDACTEDACVEGKCIYIPIQPCCGNGQCEAGESLSCPGDCAAPPRPSPAQDMVALAIDIAPTQPERAVRICETLPVETADNCFIEIAPKIGHVRVCEQIYDDAKADSCYMDFAFKKDFSVCPKIANNYLQQSCWSLAQLHAMNETVAAAAA